MCARPLSRPTWMSHNLINRRRSLLVCLWGGGGAECVSGAGASSSNALVRVESDDEPGSAVAKYTDNLETQMFVPDTQMVMMHLTAEEALRDQEASRPCPKEDSRPCPKEDSGPCPKEDSRPCPKEDSGHAPKKIPVHAPKKIPVHAPKKIPAHASTVCPWTNPFLWIPLWQQQLHHLQAYMWTFPLRRRLKNASFLF